MQLKSDERVVRRRLIAASCALLGATVARSPMVHAEGNTQPDDVVVDSALAYYQESNGLIQAVEPVIRLTRNFGDDSSFTLNLAFDTLSGSSPNGALTSSGVQTFASPSGSSLTQAAQTYTTASGTVVSSSSPVYAIDPGKLPVDPNFRDQRYAVGGTWQLPLDRVTRLSLGANISNERDFLSLAASGSIARDFNEKNTTLSLGINEEHDAVNPVGGAPVPDSDYAQFRKTGNKSKNGTSVQLGLTQVMSRRWITEFNLTADRFSGYLNDPYKIVSLVDTTGATQGYVYEKRPDSRTRKSAYLENRVAWERASVALALRYMSDDWSVRSDTAQLRVRWWNPEHDRYLEPTLRWYKQTAADFYKPWVDWVANTTSLIGTDVSADTRLGAFHALTYGLKYAVAAGDDSEFSVRVEYYQQHADHTVAGPGTLAGLDLFPALKAATVQIGYRFSY